MTVDEIFPKALQADRRYLIEGNDSRQLCVFYLRKSVGDDFATQVLRCLQFARTAKMRLDIAVGNEGVYYDDDKSGSKAIERPGYNALMTDIITGRLSGRSIIVRDQDRLSRRESSVLEDYHITTEMGKVRTYDSSGREIRDDVVTGIMGVVSRNEAKKTGYRQRIRKELRAIEGLPPNGGQRRTGYTSQYDAIVWEEAKMLRHARRKIVAGMSSYRVVKDLKRMGYTKPNGKLYSVADIGRFLKDPVYAGLRVFSRDIVIEGRTIPKGSVVAKGGWPKIFTESEHYEVAGIIGKNKKWSGEGKVRHLLTGILVCGQCGTKMGYGPKHGGRRKDGSRTMSHIYVCLVGKGGCGNVSRNAKVLEAFFVGLTYEALKRLPVEPVRPEVDTTSIEVERQQKKIADAVQAFKDDRIDIGELADIRQDAQAKIAAQRKIAASKPQRSQLGDADEFLNAETLAKRDVIRRLFPVVGVRSGGKGVRFDPDQLIFPESMP
ncbi:hypothetical protein GCM10022243_09980 [Saccharothrix violaceirubra]|uniref:DNA invertase Pin-like site-specific DNA recombinase n=1 Tax=Saccharothrix violaceirubra TaxID=413306 RepID=A0A7W7T6L5_9PSEU|nr:recombinase family protein [Saccharothrix violaceirubra]MBB4966165.1 DNA invertase Pin-like site-specific DNA recombinase [Saccharothrix violaceirubra]